jgi:hypothetical protein
VWRKYILDLKVITAVHTTRKKSGICKWRIIKLKSYVLLQTGYETSASSCRQECRTWCLEFGVRALAYERGIWWQKYHIIGVSTFVLGVGKGAEE